VLDAHVVEFESKLRELKVLENDDMVFDAQYAALLAFDDNVSRYSIEPITFDDHVEILDAYSITIK
jgi:hypothetical protein